MPDVFRRGGVDRIFGDVRRVIADPLEMARDEHQIQITAQLFRILRDPLDQPSAGIRVISSSALSRAFSPRRVDSSRTRARRCPQHCIARRASARSTTFRASTDADLASRLARDVDCLVGHAFEIGGKLHRRNHPARSEATGWNRSSNRSHPCRPASRVDRSLHRRRSTSRKIVVTFPRAV